MLVLFQHDNMSKPNNKRQVDGDGQERPVKCRRVEVTAGIKKPIGEYKSDQLQPVIPTHHYSDIPLLRRTITPTYHYSDTQLLRCTVTPTHYYSDAPLLRRTITPMHHYSDAPLLRRTIIPIYHYSDAPLLRRTITPTYHYSDVPLLRCTITPMHHCSENNMFRPPRPNTKHAAKTHPKKFPINQCIYPYIENSY